MVRRRSLLFAGAAFGAVLVAFGVTLAYSRAWHRGLLLKPLDRVPTTERVVALAFDDGPSSARTPPLLALLSRCGVKATFFMIGANIEKYPAIAASVHQNGHLIGNHSYSHQHMVFRTPLFIRSEIDKTDRLIAGAGQAAVELFRPPYCSKYVLLPIILRQKAKRLVTGTYDPPAQYRAPYEAELVAAQVLSNVQPGTIVFLHDGMEMYPEAFVESIRLTIEGLRAQGYSFATLD